MKDIADFHHQVTLGFIDQCEREMAQRGLTQKALAVLMGVSEARVSQVFRNPANLTLKTVSKLALALGWKASVVLYDDRDPTNQKGAMSPNVFVACWEALGAPDSLWEAEYAPGRPLMPKTRSTKALRSKPPE